MLKVVRVVAACAGLAVVGCGGSKPGDDVIATVNGATIPQAEFQHWLNVTAKSSATPNARVPDAPRYERCVADKRSQQSDKATAELERQCREEYGVLRDSTMRLLITRRWFEGEASKLGVKVSDADVTRAFDAQRSESFPAEADFQKFLKQTGQTPDDIKARVRLDLLSKAIRAQVVSKQGAVSDTAISDFYEDKGKLLAQPEKRDLRVVVTTTREEAAEARAELAGGASWASVVREHSIDEVTRSFEGKLAGQVKSKLGGELGEAAFAAERGELSQPIKTDFGYYVFTVTKIAEPQGQSLDATRDTIRETLEAERDRDAINAFVKDLKARWRARTDCREGYATVECRNGPKEAPKPPEMAILD